MPRSDSGSLVESNRAESAMSARGRLHAVVPGRLPIQCGPGPSRERSGSSLVAPLCASEDSDVMGPVAVPRSARRVRCLEGRHDLARPLAPESNTPSPESTAQPVAKANAAIRILPDPPCEQPSSGARSGPSGAGKRLSRSGRLRSLPGSRGTSAAWPAALGTGCGLRP